MDNDIHIRCACIEYELTRRMQQDGATEMVTAGHSATLKSSVSYDQTRLQAVMELVPEEDLVKAGAFTPEHEETTTVPARWNVTKLNPFARRGREIREVIDAARMEGVPRLTVQKERDRGG